MALHEKAEAGVTQEAAESYFSSHRNWYLSLPRRKFLQVFVPVTNLVSADEAMHRLDDLFRKNASTENALWITEDQLRKKWGPTLARQIFALPLSKWSEPIRSTRGWHRCIVLEEELQKPYELDEVRTKVVEDLRRHLKQKVYQEEIARLKTKYKIEWIN